MLDRRLLAGTVLVVVVVLGARQAMTSDAPADNRDVASAPAVRVDGPTPIARPARAAASSTIEASPATASSTVPVSTQPSTTIVSSSTTVAELLDLVDAARPTLPPGEVVDDGHDHHNHGTAAADAGTIASHVVVTAWTWRFAASDDRVATGLEGYTTAEVIATLTPDAGERARRADAGEVAWVIVRELAIDDELVTVTFDHHLVTSTTPETITTRQVIVTVVDDLAVDVTEVSG